MHIILLFAFLFAPSFADIKFKFNPKKHQIGLEDGTKLVAKIINQTDAVEFLATFGYVSPNEARSALSSDKVKDVIIEYQHFMGLKETGELDKATLGWMNLPRCGLSDKPENPDPRAGKNRKAGKNSRRVKRFTVGGTSWKKNTLTWKMTGYSRQSQLRNKESEIQQIMKKAFSVWAEHIPVEFVQVHAPETADIDIKFGRTSHGDPIPFDGPGKTLAHAFFPQYGGDCHFDDDEPWTIKTGSRGIDLLSVAIHEFGHSLGLAHSNVREAMMFPTYHGARTKLDPDDITGIQSLYAKKSEPDDPYGQPSDEIPNAYPPEEPGLPPQQPPAYPSDPGQPPLFPSDPVLPPERPAPRPFPSFPFFPIRPPFHIFDRNFVPFWG